MNPEITKIIEQYLANELNEQDKIAFEERLKTNKELQTELEKQKTIHQAAERAATRTQINQIGKSYHLKQKFKIAAIGVGVVLILAIASYLFLNNFKPSDSERLNQEALNELYAELDDKAPLSRVPIEYFEWENEAEVLLSKSGVLLSIPEHAFLLNGKPYKGKATIQYQEAIDGATIVKSGLSTESDGRLLETQGMFGIQAFTSKGEKLTINPEVGIYVQVPVDEYKDGMQLFSGEKEANGKINWVDPVPLSKIPVPVDMEDLDFYPVGYEPFLNKNKRNPDKKYRDSLYLSLEDMGSSHESILEKEKIDSISEIGKQLFESKCIICHGIKEDKTGPKLFRVREAWNKGGAKDGTIYAWVHDWQYAITIDEYAKSRTSWSSTAADCNMMFKGNSLTNEKISKIFDYVDGVEPITNYIPPSKVLAFWKPNFNNTLLATREFEKRMQAIHNTCNDKVLAIYTNGLDKPMKALDEQVVGMGFENFNDFVTENVGALNPDSPHLKGLKAFYEKGILQLKAVNSKNKKAQREKEQKWDNSVQKERAKEGQRTNDRNAKALDEEYKFNLKHVEKQLGRSVGFQIHGGGTIYNIDKYVMDATVSRTTTTITDPETRKTAIIKYNDFKFEVENSADYSTLYAYVFPSKLNSYQRIDGKSGKFDYPLNDEIVYDVAIVGINDKGYYYFQKKFIKSGDLGQLKLSKVSEAALNASIHSLNESRGIFKPMSIKQEIAWLQKEQENYKVIKKRREEAEFINELKAIVFPCSSGDSIIVQSVNDMGI